MKSLFVRASRPEAVYSSGEMITFTVNASEIDSPIQYTVSHSRKGILAKGNTRPNQEIRIRAEDPGFLEVILEEENMTAMAAAAVAPEQIVPVMEAPSDLFGFWNAEIEKQKRQATVAERHPVAPLDDAAYQKWHEQWPIFNRTLQEPFPEIETFEFSAETLYGNPARGYIAFPKHAKRGSLPALLTLHGAGVADSDFPKACSAARNGFLAMDINAHGLPCGKDPQFYQELRETKLNEYFKFGRENAKTSYLASIYLRTLRALDYLTEQPEWDGKNLITWGCSQGGCLALVCASLDQRVTKCCAGVPAFCDCADQRFASWALLNQKDPPELQYKVMKEMQYCSIAHLVEHAQAKAYFTVGFIDTTCPPDSVYTAYNRYAGQKRIYNAPDSGHMNIPTEIWMDDFTKFMKS